MPPHRRVALLDRDGTIVLDKVYLSDPDDLEFTAGAIEGLRLLRDAGFDLVLVTNQSGIARKYFTVDALEKVHRRLVEMLAAEGLKFAAIYYCPHGPGDACTCRKPSPGMIYAAQKELGFAAEEAVLIGDSDADMGAAAAAGIFSVRIGKGDSEARDFLSAARIVVDKLGMKIDRLGKTTAQAELWLRDLALPLAATAGFDAGVCAFQEQLNFDHSPVVSAPFRAMVQARQISVFADAALRGLYPHGRDLALGAARRILKTHLAADGAPGWVFSIDRSGGVADAKRDLYAHAFALYGLSWALRLEQDPDFEGAIDATLAVIDGLFADPLRGGCWDALPRADALRRQNPHMHLFEAYIALYEVTGREDVLNRARSLQRLAVERFINLETGALREYFDDTWQVYPAPGEGSVEPGHLFEWAWLLRRFEEVSGEDQTAVVGPLLRLALTAGLDQHTGRIVDEISEDGQLRSASSRSWPHAEALKALALEAVHPQSVLPERFDADMVIAAILDRLCEKYCRSDLGGGWYDHLDPDDRPLSKVMPASTLYHIYFGMSAAHCYARREKSPSLLVPI